jgi:NTE family protein
MTRVIDAEITALQATGTRVLRLHPTSRELAAMGPKFMDPRRRLPALDTALAHIPPRLSPAWKP